MEEAEEEEEGEVEVEEEEEKVEEGRRSRVGWRRWCGRVGC